MDNPRTLNQVFERRWVVPILAQLADEGGCKFVTLSSRLDGSRDALRASLSLLSSLGLVVPNSGHGHPMRPEYVLTNRGEMVSHPAKALVNALQRADSLDVGLKKWSMPTLHCVGLGSDRFRCIAQSLGTVTDRALSIALKDMNQLAFIEQTLQDGRPPYRLYSISRSAKNIASVLRDLDAVVGRNG